MTGNLWWSRDPKGRHKRPNPPVDIGVSIRFFDQPCLVAKWVFDRDKVVGEERNSLMPTIMILENIFENSLPTVFHQCKKGVKPVDKGAIK